MYKHHIQNWRIFKDYEGWDGAVKIQRRQHPQVEEFAQLALQIQHVKSEFLERYSRRISRTTWIQTLGLLSDYQTSLCVLHRPAFQKDVQITGHLATTSNQPVVVVAVTARSTFREFGHEIAFDGLGTRERCWEADASQRWSIQTETSREMRPSIASVFLRLTKELTEEKPSYNYHGHQMGMILASWSTKSANKEASWCASGSPSPAEAAASFEVFLRTVSMFHRLLNETPAPTSSEIQMQSALSKGSSTSTLDEGNLKTKPRYSRVKRHVGYQEHPEELSAASRVQTAFQAFQKQMPRIQQRFITSSLRQPDIWSGVVSGRPDTGIHSPSANLREESVKSVEVRSLQSVSQSVADRHGFLENVSLDSGSSISKDAHVYLVQNSSKENITTSSEASTSALLEEIENRSTSDFSGPDESNTVGNRDAFTLPSPLVINQLASQILQSWRHQRGHVSTAPALSSSATNLEEQTIWQAARATSAAPRYSDHIAVIDFLRPSEFNFRSYGSHHQSADGASHRRIQAEDCSQHGTESSKRCRDGSGSSDEADDETPKRPRKSAMLKTETRALKPRRLACPYNKYDARRYSERNTLEKEYMGCSRCFLPTIARLKYVKRTAIDLIEPRTDIIILQAASLPSASNAKVLLRLLLFSI